MSFNVFIDGTENAKDFSKEIKNQTFGSLMKRNLNGTLGLLALLALGGQGAQANNRASNVKPGVYYRLTPAVAEALDIDLLRLRSLVTLQASDELAFKVEEDGELDLSIYAGGIFTQIRADIVKSH